MMPSCASAAKLRAAGPFSRSASGARFEYGFPPPRIVNSAVVLKTQRERRMVLSAMLVPVKPFQDAGIHIGLCGDESARCSASNRFDLPNRFLSVHAVV